MSKKKYFQYKHTYVLSKCRIDEIYRIHSALFQCYYIVNANNEVKVVSLSLKKL